MKKISEDTISLLKSYFALKVMAGMETETYNAVVSEILRRNQFKVDMSKVADHEYYDGIYNAESVILSPSDDALYVFMTDEDIEKLKDEEKAAGIMNEDGTSVHLCTETKMREVLRLFMSSCLKDVEMRDFSNEVLSLDHFNTLRDLCIGLVVSYCDEHKIELSIAA